RHTRWPRDWSSDVCSSDLLQPLHQRGVSADTAFDPTLVQWLQAADLVVHEASGGFMHTPYADLAALPETLRKKMRLIHYPDDFRSEERRVGKEWRSPWSAH